MITIEHSKLANDGCTIDRIKNAPSGDFIIENMGNQNGAGSQKKLAKIPQFDKPIVYFETSFNFAPEEKYMAIDEYNRRYAEFYKNLVPNKKIQDNIIGFKKKYDFENKYVVGVHYRSWDAGPSDDRGDELRRDLNFRYVSDYIKEMKAILHRSPEKVDNKEVLFFLAADSPDVKKAILSDPDLKNVVVTRNDRIERETKYGQESALVDLFLLGGGEFIIGTYQSSFSDEAKFLTKERRKINMGEPAYNTNLNE